MIHLLDPTCLNQFLGPRPQGQGLFQNFMILLDLPYDFGENEVLFVKIETRVPDIWLDTSFGPKWSKHCF